ncbi:retrovirus-related pol polyprotein from transposon TNT 1-94 [Tanacetum coccineum]
MIQRNLQAQVITNDIVKRRNRTLVEAARTMLLASKLPLSFWAEAVATACYTQNRSIIISTHGKTAYHIINDRKPSIKHLHIFGCICYITRDGENLDKMKEKGDPCVMVGYSTQSKGYRVYNKRTRLIVESIHIKFDEIKEMMSDHNSSDLAPQRQEMSVENVSSGLVPQGQKASDYDNSDPVPPRQNVVPFPSSIKTDSYINQLHPARNIDNTDVHSFQPQSHDFRWTRDHPLEQIRGNPSMPVQTNTAWPQIPEKVCSPAPRLTSLGNLDRTFGKMFNKAKVVMKNKKMKIRLPDLVQAVCYCARYQARPTQKHLKEVKRIFKYLKGTINMGLWYPKDSGFELTAFSDADHAGCIDTRKSTSGGIQFLGDKLVSWMSKKQNCTAMSSAEAEYVALSASCAQVMWMRTHLQDYGFNYNKIPLYCDSQSAIAISCNPVQHSRTKHIHTRYHFIKEQVENGIIELYFVRTEYQLADMFTKALPEDRFKYLVRRIGMRCLTPAELEVLTNETA